MVEFTTARHEKDSNGQYERVGDNIYRLSINPDTNKLLFERNGIIKTVKVEDSNNGCIYDIKKTRINANGGACGLYNFLSREILNNTTGGSALVVFNKVFDYMK